MNGGPPDDLTVDMTGEVAVVTGGTRGIGRAVAERLADRGAATVATYHADADAAGETEDSLEAYDAPTAVRRFDVRDGDEVAAAFEAIAEEFGQPSILVNNAGIMRNALLVRMDPEEWADVIDVNLTGAFHCTRAAARGMLRRGGGRIVSVASVAGLRGWPGQANYAASKAGLVGFTRAVARELGGKGIRANVVCPGYVDTALYEAEIEGADDALREQIPQERIAEPGEVADAVAFLASPDASYVNGAVLRIDGGMLA